MRILLIIIAAVFAFGSETLSPFKKIKYQYYISKIAFNKKFLVAGLENGDIVIKDFNTLKGIYKLTLPKRHDFMGDLEPMPIYSLDISPDNKNLLILAEGDEAKRILYILDLKGYKLKKVFTSKETFMKARYLSNSKILFGLLSDELAVFDLDKNQTLNKNQIDSYVFSTFALNNDKTKAAVGDESGSVKVVDIKSLKVIKKIAAFNKDKTLSLDYQQNLIINGSADKRIGIYTDNGYEKVTLKAEFLPYASALSPKLDTFAIQYNEKNQIKVFSIYKKPLFILNGHTMALNGMKYLNKNEIISFSPAEIIIWKLKE